jgi:outer membrane protein
MKKKQISFQKEVERRTKELQDFVIRNEEKARGGLLSENEIMQIQQRAQQMEQQIMLYQQNEGGRLEEERGKKTEILMNKIKGFGKKFSEKNGIDLLFMDGELSQINYISPNMDVTTEFVNYLNENQAEIEAEFKKK